MPADLNLLVPEFRSRVISTLSACARVGFVLVPFFTLRDTLTQAKLWRQSRTADEVRRAVGRLRRDGAPWLAGVLDGAGPQHGRWATNALPGQSWHQWGEAVDCFVKGENGHAIWAATHPGYAAYATAAREKGLTAGFDWVRKDAVHVQLRAESVRDVKTWAEINDAMRSRFGG